MFRVQWLYVALGGTDWITEGSYENLTSAESAARRVSRWDYGPVRVVNCKGEVVYRVD